MPRLILSTSTVSILRRAHSGNRVGSGSAAVAARALDDGIDASDDGSLVELSLSRNEVDALLRLAAVAVYDWQNGDLDGGSEVYDALEVARGTLESMMDEMREGELDGLAAARDHDRAYGEDTPSHDVWVRNDAGEYLGIH